MFLAAWGVPAALLDQLHARQADRIEQVSGYSSGSQVTSHGPTEGPKIAQITGAAVMMMMMMMMMMMIIIIITNSVEQSPS
jgi:hypothetical protein